MCFPDGVFTCAFSIKALFIHIATIAASKLPKTFQSKDVKTTVPLLQFVVLYSFFAKVYLSNNTIVK